jgi:hypothetical protein
MQNTINEPKCEHQYALAGCINRYSLGAEWITTTIFCTKCGEIREQDGNKLHR